jgi:preprotein translocase subunit SecE
MAVAEAVKMTERGEDGNDLDPKPKPDWLTWAPRKLAEARNFFVEVRAELKKVTWPSRDEVQTTTVVVIVTTVVFGFYLFGLDLGFSYVFRHVLR